MFCVSAPVDVCALGHVEGVVRAGPIRFLARHGMFRPYLGGPPLLCIAFVVLVDQVRHMIIRSTHTFFHYGTPTPSPLVHMCCSGLLFVLFVQAKISDYSYHPRSPSSI